MPIAAAEAYQSWHDFYLLLGAAAATVIGAMFVVASIGTGFLTRQHGPQIREFLTPTVIHLTSVILLAALAVVPTLGWQFVAIAFAIGGGGGMAYSLVIGWRISRRRVEWSDHLWYALLPIVAYAALLAAALSILFRSAPNLEAVAGAAALLLVAGIRNAWDMILFFVTRPPDRT
jgi:hypothetical protein